MNLAMISSASVAIWRSKRSDSACACGGFDDLGDGVFIGVL
jgi:hypothetical protein